MTRAEILWLAVRFAGRDDALPDDTVRPADTIPAAIGGYRAAWAVTGALVRTASLDEPCRQAPGETPVNLRWVLMHLLEETARHAGHADILRELIDGSTGR